MFDSFINRGKSEIRWGKIRDIIFNIDKELPNDLRKEYGLSSYRKELIFKLIKERILRLKNIIL